MAPSNFGLIGRATASAPSDFLAELIAEAQAADEKAFKRESELKKQGLDERRVGVDEGQLGLSREKFGAEQAKQAADEAEFQQTLASSPEWLKPVLKLRRAGLQASIKPEDAVMSPQQQADAEAKRKQEEANAANAEWTRRENTQFGHERTLAGMRQSSANEPLVPTIDPVTQQTVYTPRSQAAGAQVPARNQQPTGEQQKTIDYFTRMLQAEDDARAVEDQVGNMALLGLNSSWIPDQMLGENAQRYAQAMRAWTLAKLRRESGAAISAGEFENERKAFFRQPNDKTLDQKRKDRLANLRGMAQASGQAFQRQYGDQSIDDVLARFASKDEQAQSSMPKVGEERTANGETRRWNGSEWVKIK